ncbi:ATP-binding protein [Oceanospirillaceae bacterium]|nr:ATP-binding protein [Oceanospirillaceae bacterium]
MKFFSSKAHLLRQISLLLCILTSGVAAADKIPNFTLTTAIQLLDISSLHWADASRTATPTQAKVDVVNGNIIAGGFAVPTEQASHWFAFTLTNPTDQLLTPSIYLRQAFPTKVNLHYQQKGQWVSLLNGTDVSIKQRQVNKLTPIFNVLLDANQSKTFYLEIHSKIKLLKIDINIGEAKNSNVLGNNHITLVNIYTGIALIFFLINSILWLSFKQRIYLYYSAYILSFIASTLVINSFDLFFNWIEIEDRSVLFLAYNSMIFFLALFTSEVLDAKQDMPRVYIILKTCCWLAIATALATLVDGSYFSYTILAFVPVSVLFLGILIYAGVLGKTSARFLAMGVAAFLSGIVCVYLVTFGFVTANVLTEHGALVGSLIEMVFFSMALFSRLISINAKINNANATLLKISQSSNVLLEKTVMERTLELSKAKETAERANEARGQFLSTISHEVRTPLNGILGMIEVLQGHPLPSLAKDQLATLDSASNQLNGLVNNVLDFSKIDQGMLELHTAKFDLHRLINQLKRSFEHQALAKSITLKVTVNPKVTLYWQGDELRIQQILSNLVSNAIKFTAKGGVHIKVTLENTEAENSNKSNAKGLFFSVSDTGAGINETDLSLVFNAYHQVGQRYQKHTSGSGLGLAISQQLAHAMGGNISVTSKLNQGSTFELRLILEEGESTNEPIKLPSFDSFSYPNLSQKSILVVDDSDINRKVVEAYLQLAQAHLILCSSGHEALEYFKTHDVDIVLMDLQIPDLDGFEVCRRMRLIEQNLQRPRSSIILHTADARSELIVTASAAGIDHCLFKPYSQAQLMHTMKLSLAINSSKSSLPSSSNTSIKLNNDPSLDGLTALFFQQATVTLNACAKHIEAGDYSNIKALLHQLAGSTSLFGAHEMNTTLTKMNALLSFDEKDKIDYADLKTLLILAQQQLKAYQKKPKAG